MPATSLMTTLEDFEGVPSFVSNNTRYGGGQGASQNTDIIREKNASGGRRGDNSATAGWGVVIPTTNMTAANTHVKIWASITQWAQLNALGIAVASGSGLTAGDIHQIPSNEWPQNSGFIAAFVDVSRTPENGASANLAAINEIGIQVNIGDVGGNAQNIIGDRIDFGTSGLRWTGTGGSLQDFRDLEVIEAVGVFQTDRGVDFCLARIEIAGGFDDTDFSVTFPNQATVSDTFMGVSVDLDTATAPVNLGGGEFKSSSLSSATKRPDYIVTGTGQTHEVPTLRGMRLIQLTSACTVDGEAFHTISLTQGGATIQNATVSAFALAGFAVCADADFTKLQNVRWVQAGSGHAIIINTPGTYTLDSQFFSGFGADGTTSAAIYNNSGGLVTLNVVSNGDTPTIRNGTGASTVVNNNRALTLSDAPLGSVLVITDDQNPPNELFRQNFVNGDQIYSYPGADAGNTVKIIITPDPALDGDLEIINRTLVLQPTDQLLSFVFTDDRVYSNPT